MKARSQLGVSDGRLFPEGRVAGPMPWVIAIMMFLTVLAAAAGLGLSAGAGRLESQIGNRITVQIVEPDPARREAQARAAEAALRASSAVRTAERVPDAEVGALLEPWLGAVAADADIPVPAMIDVELGDGARAGLPQLRAAILRAAPAAVVADTADWLGPLSSLMSSLQWLALGLVTLMVGATAATVVLAARASLNTHNHTIEILHLMGATDRQIARLFQRRIALDVLSGGLLGFAIGVVVLLLIGGRVEAIGSELLGTVRLPDHGWVVLVLLPLGGALLALLVARVTILRALGRLL